MNRIKKLRIKKGLTQSQLAKEIGLSNQIISFYENGKREPKIDKLKLLADYFKVSVPYLQGLENCPHRNSFKFELVKKYQDQPDLLPKRETKYSAGYDFKAAEDVVVDDSLKPVLVHTGVKVKLNKKQVLLIANRSSNPMKRGLILANGIGVIDADYYNNPKNEGEILGMFYCTDTHIIHRGDRIMQGIVVNYAIAEDDQADGKRLGGIGSTGEK